MIYKLHCNTLCYCEVFQKFFRDINTLRGTDVTPTFSWHIFYSSPSLCPLLLCLSDFALHHSTHPYLSGRRGAGPTLIAIVRKIAALPAVFRSVSPCTCASWPSER